jgi:hypothetical protein
MSTHVGDHVVKRYEFTVMLVFDVKMTEEVCDRLFEAGCDDGSPGTGCGWPYIDFTRETDYLESAIRSAVGDVERAGCKVARVQLDRDSSLFSRLEE